MSESLSVSGSISLWDEEDGEFWMARLAIIEFFIRFRKCLLALGFK